MYPAIVKEGRGRPAIGSEVKSKERKIRIEKTLDDELIYTCRVLGIPVSEGVRRGIILFIRDVHKSYY